MTPCLAHTFRLSYLCLYVFVPHQQSFEREIDSAYSRLLTVQGSFAGALEDNVKLQRELEAERLKSAIAVRRVESTIEQNDTVLANIRRDSARVQLQRDR